MKSTSHFNWIKGAIWAITLGLISAAVYDYFKAQIILTSIQTVIINIWMFLVNLFAVEIKLWVIFLVLFIYKLFKWFYSTHQKNKVPNLPENLKNYKDDNFKNWRWKWNWQWDLKQNKWTVINLWPYCKTCDIKLLDKSSLIQNLMKCPKCHKYFENSEIDDPKGVKSIIYDNIEKGRI